VGALSVAWRGCSARHETALRTFPLGQTGEFAIVSPFALFVPGVVTRTTQRFSGDGAVDATAIISSGAGRAQARRTTAARTRRRSSRAKAMARQERTIICGHAGEQKFDALGRRDVLRTWRSIPRWACQAGGGNRFRGCKPARIDDCRGTPGRDTSR
jgi:hypothetical protein